MDQLHKMIFPSLKMKISRNRLKYIQQAIQTNLINFYNQSFHYHLKV
jgi:hypothetical protein